MALLAWRYGDVRWLALFTGFGPVELPGFDWSRSVGAHGWGFDEAALTSAGALFAEVWSALSRPYCGDSGRWTLPRCIEATIRLAARVPATNRGAYQYSLRRL